MDLPFLFGEHLGGLWWSRRDPARIVSMKTMHQRKFYPLISALGPAAAAVLLGAFIALSIPPAGAADSATIKLGATAAASQPAGRGTKTGLPLPRFVSLRSDKVYLRTGPGDRYPVEWVLIYRHMPIEIIAEFDTWRKIRDWQGSVGWVHQSMVSGNRWVMVRKGRQPLRRAGKDQAPITARIGEKVIGRLKSCRNQWCEIDFSGFTGWMRRDQVWGVYPREKVK
jgi:SH3-like domain-containing protein